MAEPRAVSRATLNAAVAKGFGPWGNSAPSIEWPRFVRALWWKATAADGEEATLCASCRVLLDDFAPQPYEHKWLAGLQASIAAAGLQTPDIPELGGVREIDELAQQLARDILGLPAGEYRSLAGGFKKHGEKYGLAAATILLTGEIKAETLRPRYGAADLLGEWNDPRATACLVRALRGPMYVVWVAPNLIRRGDPNALPEVAATLANFLTLDDTYATTGEPPYKTPFLNQQTIRAAHPEIDQLDEIRIAQSSVAISHLLRVVTTLGEREWRIGAAREIYAHSLFHDDVRAAAANLLQFADPADADAIAVSVAGQGYEGSMGESFQHSLDFLEGRRSPAGWWAMDRFCRTAEYWQDRVGAVRKSMSRIPKPSDEALRKYERRYGRFVDFTRTGKAAPPSGGGCFIATAAYGSEDHAVVARLRAFRDGVLRRSHSGRAAIRMYERMSPPIARVVARSSTARAVARTLIRSIARSTRAL